MVLGVRVPRKIHTVVARGSEIRSANRWTKEGQAEFFSTVNLATRFDSSQGVRKVSFARNSEAMEPQAKVQKLDVSHDGENGHSNGHEKLAVAARSLRVKKLSPHAIVPSRGSALAAGYDLSSAYESVVPARGKALVKTDLSIAIPEGTYGRVAPRSGLAWKHSIDVGAGVIDADYRGPVGVILFNHSDTDFIINAGDRIAQLILELIVTPDVLEVEDLDATVRGEGGFGSTGISLVVEK